ncbi:hypothetical protein [Stenotrophomonas sp.]|uniref:hypothetical protein n=1 Tax=Stenotrophomonas sp. TaxID=69392 RepID=UPI0028ABC92B|nr:hypothetical protein [Stenotrophomonas sp.]
MKHFSCLLALGLLGVHGTTYAETNKHETTVTLGLTRSLAAEALAFPAQYPPEAQPVEIERWIYGRTTFSARPFPKDSYVQHPGRKVGTVGFISYTPFPGARTLYSCITNDGQDFFTSEYENCEGQRKMTHMPILGYIATTQLPGTVPLYRCIRGGFKPRPWADHFDTISANCENQSNPTNEGIRGYIWL